ncbi:hypothetical protein [Phenylobacterium sp.]|uniref:hypothetical protein n=1 Tax=Phenylobacterium sp. TaxID=1871053 RepID=UPI0011F699FA|nr:hypothetical protein [Phenylobacterium sp.]THD61628.1 MAG: hypothetical protein E8A49_11705 [Phenylobacterium sp.]
MRLPNYAPPVARRASAHKLSAALLASGCDVWKKVACAGAVAGCVAVCAGSDGVACGACIAGLGDCRDCL